MTRLSISSRLAVVFLFLCCGCESFLSEKTVTEPLDAFSKILNQEPKSDQNWSRAELVDLVNHAVARAVVVANHPPKFYGRISADGRQTKRFIEKNGTRILEWLAEFDEPLRSVRKVLWASSEHALSGIAQPRESALDYGVSFLALRGVQTLARSLEGALFPLVAALGMSEQDSTFSRAVVTKYSLYVGLGIIATQDLNRVSDRLRLLPVPEALAKLLGRLAVQVHASGQRLATENQPLAKQNIESEAQGFARVRALEGVQALLGQTLLYVPGQPFSVWKVLAVISNLTWGLLNTAVGAGIILVAAVASPFTELVDFPTFSISDSGFQIWVGLRGMVYPNHAFSIGVWVFGEGPYQHDTAHEGGHSFQSALLGPFYLPTVGLSYMFQGHAESFMERWADDWISIAG